jgi:hypothetical protein
MRVVEDIPEPIYGFAMRPRLIAEYAPDLSQRKRENCVAAALQRWSYRLGTDEFAEAKNYRGICKIVRRRQILPQQILRHLDAIGNYAIRTHRKTRQTLIFSFGNSLVVAALDFNIYQLLAWTPKSHVWEGHPEQRTASLCHRRWHERAQQPRAQTSAAVERGSEPRADFGIDDLLDGRSKIFVRTRSKRCQEALGAASRSEKKTALTLDHSARLGRERALRADPWSIIDSVAAEIILHGKSADER